jgi:hypothetical protein
MEKSKQSGLLPALQTETDCSCLVRTGRSAMNHQTVNCTTCKKEFDVLVSDPIIGGPFPE